MRFSPLFSFCSFAVSITAAIVLPNEGLVARDINGVLAVMDRVNTGITKLGADMKLWLGDFEGARRILVDAKQVLNDVQTGTQYIDAQQTLGVLDTLSLVIPMTTLNTNFDTFTTQLIDKKPQIDQLRLAGNFLNMIQQTRGGVIGLSKAIASKLPTATSWSVEPMTNQIVQKLDKAIVAFGGRPPQPPSPSQPQFQNPPLYQPQPGPYQPQPSQYRPQPPPYPLPEPTTSSSWWQWGSRATASAEAPAPSSSSLW
jgi:hypothetical protein